MASLTSHIPLSAVVAPLGVLVLALMAIAITQASCARSTQARKSSTLPPQPAWRWFCVSNVVSVVIFIASISYLLTSWTTQPQPAFLVAAAGALGSLLYFFAGITLDVEYDAIIVGAGTAGAALATVLARDGKRVLLVERTLGQYPRIVGELLQPGGVRALERMGLGDTCKNGAVDGVTVQGYVCITPGAGQQRDLVLTYPTRDPTSASEYFGLLESDARPVVVNAGGARSDALPANVCPVTGADLEPRGRSFHNTRFVHRLRLAALDEANVHFVAGSMLRLVTAKDVACLGTLRSSSDAPRFAGFDDADRPIPATPAEAEASEASKSSRDVGMPADRVAGIVWKDELGVERLATARLTIAADGMYSQSRKALHAQDYRIISHFAGLLLHHPPHETPLPYPNRGHVVMADPSPVLLYQISSTETRVLVDVPGDVPSINDGGLRDYFLTVTAPQLPECVRAAFIEAAMTQTPIVMPNRMLPSAPPAKEGAILLGDSWNMRHPLTGGGMTVALRDVEALAAALHGLDMRSCSEAMLTSALTAFQSARVSHAITINILAVALYRVFSKPANDDGTRARLRAACIDYMSLGGACTAGPVGLLSGLTPKPEVLVAHFFAVALHAMRRALLPIPTPSRLRQGYDLLHIACIIIMPLIQSEKVPVLSLSPVLWLVNAIFPWRQAGDAAL